MSMQRTTLLVSALFVGSLPALARACPVCFAAQDEAQRIALLGTTVFLTALPLILIGGVIYWLATRSVDADAREEPPFVEPSEAPAAATPAATAPEATGSFSTR